MNKRLLLVLNVFMKSRSQLSQSIVLQAHEALWSNYCRRSSQVNQYFLWQRKCLDYIQIIWKNDCSQFFSCEKCSFDIWVEMSFLGYDRKHWCFQKPNEQCKTCIISYPNRYSIKLNCPVGKDVTLSTRTPIYILYRNVLPVRCIVITVLNRVMLGTVLNRVRNYSTFS